MIPSTSTTIDAYSVWVHDFISEERLEWYRQVIKEHPFQRIAKIKINPAGKAFLQECGKYINEIALHGKDPSFQFTFKQMKSYCPSLQRITVLFPVVPDEQLCLCRDIQECKQVFIKILNMRATHDRHIAGELWKLAVKKRVEVPVNFKLNHLPLDYLDAKFEKCVRYFLSRYIDQTLLDRGGAQYIDRLIRLWHQNMTDDAFFSHREVFFETVKLFNCHPEPQFPNEITKQNLEYAFACSLFFFQLPLLRKCFQFLDRNYGIYFAKWEDELWSFRRCYVQIDDASRAYPILLKLRKFFPKIATKSLNEGWTLNVMGSKKSVKIIFQIMEHWISSLILTWNIPMSIVVDNMWLRTLEFDSCLLTKKDYEEISTKNFQKFIFHRKSLNPVALRLIQDTILEHSTRLIDIYGGYIWEIVPKDFIEANRLQCIYYHFKHYQYKLENVKGLVDQENCLSLLKQIEESNVYEWFLINCIKLLKKRPDARERFQDILSLPQSFRVHQTRTILRLAEDYPELWDSHFECLFVNYLDTHDYRRLELFNQESIWYIYSGAQNAIERGIAELNPSAKEWLATTFIAEVEGYLEQSKRKLL